MKRSGVVRTAAVLGIGLAALMMELIPPQAVGTQVSDDEARAIWGAACAKMKKQAQGACTTNQASNCTGATGCNNKKCAFQCFPTSLYVADGAGTLMDTTDTGPCAKVIKPDCELILRGCTCTGGANTDCTPSPNDQVPNSCNR
jgi:hypothetical protein